MTVLAAESPASISPADHFDRDAERLTRIRQDQASFAENLLAFRNAALAEAQDKHTFTQEAVLKKAYRVVAEHFRMKAGHIKRLIQEADHLRDKLPSVRERYVAGENGTEST